MGVVILVMAIRMIRQRAQRQPQPQPQAVPPVNNPAFEPEYAAVNYAEVGNVLPPRAPQYDTVDSGTGTYEEPHIHQLAIYDDARGPTDDYSLPTIDDVDHNETFA